MKPDAADLPRPAGQPLAGAYAAIALLIVTLVLTLTGVALWQAKLRHQERASIMTQNLSRLLEEYVVDTLDKVDLSLRSIADEFTHQPAGSRLAQEAINKFLLTQQSYLSEFESLRATDQYGTLRYGRGVDLLHPISLADRNYFMEIRDNPDAGLVIYGPVVSRISKKWVMVLARALRTTGGSFAGVVYASVSTDVFRKVISELELGPRGAATIRTAEEALIFRHPASQSPSAAIGSRDASKEFREAVRTHPQGGIYVAVNRADGIERYNAYRQVRSYPIYVVVGLATQDYLAEWKTDAYTLSPLAGIVVLLTLLSTVTIYRSSQRQAALAGAYAAEAGKVQMVIRAASDGIHMLDADGEVLEANEAFCRMLGYSREQLLGMNIREWYAGWTDSELKRLVADPLYKTAKFETRYHGCDGRALDLEISASVLEIDGRRILFCSARDISERKRVEMALRESEERLRFAMQAAHAGFWEFDFTAGRFAVSEEAIRLLGQPVETPISREKALALVHPEDRANIEDALRQIQETGQAFHVEVRIPQPDGTMRWVAAHAEVRPGPEGPQLAGLMQDISARRQAENRIETVRREQQAILNSEVVGIVKLRTRVMLWSNSAFELMLGYESGELRGKPTRLLYPDEESYIEFRDVAYPVINSGGVFRTEIQYLRKDGTLGWFDVSGAQLFPGSDESIWSFIDITRRKAAEKQLEEMAERDPLTRAYNRRKMAELFDIEVSRAQRSGRTFTAGMLDIDHFKDVNDRFGHAAGDRTLIRMVEIFRDELRMIDVVARWGGEEFLFLFHDAESPEALGIAERIRKSVDDTTFPEAGHVTVSLGLSEYRSGEDLDSLIARADAALYEAKNAGRNRTVVKT